MLPFTDQIAQAARARLNQAGQTSIVDPDAEDQAKAQSEASAMEQGQEAERQSMRQIRAAQAEDEDALDFRRKRTARSLSAGWAALEDSPTS